jgi:hypothetical protein
MTSKFLANCALFESLSRIIRYEFNVTIAIFSKIHARNFKIKSGVASLTPVFLFFILLTKE